MLRRFSFFPFLVAVALAATVVLLFSSPANLSAFVNMITSLPAAPPGHLLLVVANLTAIVAGVAWLVLTLPSLSTRDMDDRYYTEPRREPPSPRLPGKRAHRRFSAKLI